MDGFGFFEEHHHQKRGVEKLSIREEILRVFNKHESHITLRLGIKRRLKKDVINMRKPAKTQEHRLIMSDKFFYRSASIKRHVKDDG